MVYRTVVFMVLDSQEDIRGHWMQAQYFVPFLISSQFDLLLRASCASTAMLNFATKLNHNMEILWQFQLESSVVQVSLSKVWINAPMTSTSSFEEPIECNTHLRYIWQQLGIPQSDIRLVIHLQLQWYPNDFRWVMPIGSLLVSSTQTWCMPVNMKIVAPFGSFVTHSHEVWRDIWGLEEHGSWVVLMYSSKFRKLSCDVDWND